MSRENNYYSQAKHSVVVAATDGSFDRTLKDFADGDDVISAERLGDRVALTQGLDKSVVSIASTDGGQVQVRLKPTSADVGFLNGLFNRQNRTPILVNVTITTGVDDVVVLQFAGIDKPEARTTGGPTMQPVTFLFVGGKIEFDESE